MIALAGELGELLAPPPDAPVAEYVPPSPDERVAARAATALAALTRSEARLLHHLEEDGSAPRDEEQARAASWLLAHNQAAAYLDYLREVTKALMTRPSFIRLLDALVPMLLEQEVIGARRVREIFKTAESTSRLVTIQAR